MMKRATSARVICQPSSGGSLSVVASRVLRVKIWSAPPTRADVEAVVDGYFALLRAAKLEELEQLVEEHGTAHVLKALWSESAGVGPDRDRRKAAGEWKEDLSWLGELARADITWSINGGVSPYVEISYRGRILDVALSFHVREHDTGWVLAGPATLW